MNKLINALFNINYIEELARRDQWLNRINSLVKLLVTIVYIVSVASIGKYDIDVLLLYGVYPILVLITGDLPIRSMWQKMIIPVFFGASLGILNPFLDTNVIALSGDIVISAGWLSFLILFIKSMFSMLAALLLVSTTTIEEIASAFSQLKVPQIITIQFLLMFRYITILVGELDRTITAYSMRSGGQRSIDFSAWGSLMGQMFLRASDRSIRLYESMKLRGFEGQSFVGSSRKLHIVDGVYLTFWMSVFGAFIAMRIT